MTTETSPAPGLLGRVYRLPADVLVGTVRLYQIFLSPIVGRSCRYEPTCSRYFIGAVRKYGAVRGSLRGIWRICRCHPFHRGGYDPP
jgi:putative membrane protein insertion efficiency factor